MSYPTRSKDAQKEISDFREALKNEQIARQSEIEALQESLSHQLQLKEKVLVQQIAKAREEASLQLASFWKEVLEKLKEINPVCDDSPPVAPNPVERLPAISSDDGFLEKLSSIREVTMNSFNRLQEEVKKHSQIVDGELSNKIKEMSATKTSAGDQTLKAGMNLPTGSVSQVAPASSELPLSTRLPQVPRRRRSTRFEVLESS